MRPAHKGLLFCAGYVLGRRNMNYITPVGFRDVMSDEALVREDLTARVRTCFAQKGYRPVETPTLEVLDVMEAGGHVPEAPFKFFDSHGDLLAMRPDVTMQIARMCATRGVAQGKPLRLRYTQRVFREKTAEAAARELTQCGAECIGAAGSEADVELVSLLASALTECGSWSRLPSRLARQAFCATCLMPAVRPSNGKRLLCRLTTLRISCTWKSLSQRRSA